MIGFRYTEALLVRSNQPVKGISNGNQAFLISQYADETSITIDATEQSLRNYLQILIFYANASGLRADIQKTKTIWFGSCKNTNEILRPDRNLTWEQGKFTLVGVDFSADLTEMITINK